jgi:hypothetical protein
VATRLPLDANVVGYWGFDEANETDYGIDEGSYGRNLTIVASPSVAPSRVNNGRQFNGSSTYAYPISPAPFRLLGDMTLIVWPILDQVNSSGSLLRCLVECSSATDNILYGLYISSTGEIIYRHEYGAKVLVELKTATGTVRSGRYYSLALLRAANTIYLFIDNKLSSWASCTVNGATQSPTLAVPAPTGGATALLKIGKSDRLVDNGWWQGMVDELSIHDVARTYSPYLRSVYFRLTLYSNFFRLTAYNNVKSVGAAEMGGGSRWWTYERDGSLYAVRENTLGLFSPEVQITSGGPAATGAINPGGTEKPELIYDAATDTLLVAFVSSGKVYKMTAGVGDPPATQTMPYLTESSTVVKLHPRQWSEGVRLGAGVGLKPIEQVGYITRTPIKGAYGDAVLVGANEGRLRSFQKGDQDAPSDAYSTVTIAFTGKPSFGITISGSNAYGYSVYSLIGGVVQLLGYSTYVLESQLGRHFFALSTRLRYRSYFVRPLTSLGVPALTARSNTIRDTLGEVDNYYLTYPDTLVLNKDGDLPETVVAGVGSIPSPIFPVGYITRTPIKGSYGEVGYGAGVGGGLALSFSSTNAGSLAVYTRSPPRWRYP